MLINCGLAGLPRGLRAAPGAGDRERDGWAEAEAATLCANCLLCSTSLLLTSRDQRTPPGTRLHRRRSARPLISHTPYMQETGQFLLSFGWLEQLGLHA